jgi:phosphatidylinositol alpha-1,6-mannosyltransferase
MLNNEFPPLGGGMGTVNLAVLRRFAEEPNLEIDLITSALGSKHEEERFAEHVRIVKVPVNNQNLHHSSNRELITYARLALLAALRMHQGSSYDLCFAWSGVPAGGVALALRWLTGLRYLVRVSGPDIPGFERRYQWLYPVLTPLIRAIWRGAEAVVAKCKEEADMIMSADGKVRVTIVPNGVDLDAFLPPETHLDSGTLNILCVARLIERKGQHDLIRAVKKLIDEGQKISLSLVGTGDAESKYRSLAAELGIADSVIFSGYVPREEIGKYYASAHVFVLPSYNEGMSVAALEAMASGLPLIVTRTGGAADLVDEEVNGLLFNWADVEKLTDHLRRLSTSRDIIRQMGLASRARSKEFTWDRTAGRLTTIFISIAKEAI